MGLWIKQGRFDESLLARDRTPHNMDDPGRKMSTVRMSRSQGEEVEHVRKLRALGVESVENLGALTLEIQEWKE